MRDLVRQTWLVLVLAVVFGAALAFTDKSTAGRIARNRRQQIYELAQKATLGELTIDANGQPEIKIELSELANLKKEHDLTAYKVLPRGKADGACLGYVLIAEGIGWDRLRILIALSTNLTEIIGLEIIDCRETPGLGARITTDAFRQQYHKRTDKPLELVKHAPEGDYQVQALTGATISSDAVTKMVNETVQKARQCIR